MSSDARTKVRGALYRFKQVMETGEFATSRGHPAVAGRDQPSRSASGESKRSDVRDIASGEVRR
jgi:hypothetical protein